MTTRRTEGVLLTGVYGSGKSSVAEAAASIAAAEDAGVEDVTIRNGRTVRAVARDVMAYLGRL